MSAELLDLKRFRGDYEKVADGKQRAIRARGKERVPLASLDQTPRS
jgi:hypothetical protein